jgi:hypothetical protein
MLDRRVRTLLTEFRNGTRGVEETAQGLLRVRRETGCLDLHVAASADSAERALVTRFAELVRADDGTPASDDGTRAD